MRVNTRLFRTSAFRLTAVYLLFFVASLAVLLSYIYYSTVGLLEREHEGVLSTEVAMLDQENALGGVPGLSAGIDALIRRNPAVLVMLADNNGQHIAGNLRSPPISQMPDNTWVDFPLQDIDGNAVAGHTAHGFNVQYGSGNQLLIAEDVQSLSQFRNLVQQAFFAVLGFAAILGLVGSFWISRSLLNRIDDITAMSHRIMAGDITGRMPVSGTNDEIDRLLAALNTMLDQIEKLIRGIREVSSNVAHDLRTPLTRMRARVESALWHRKKEDLHLALQQTLSDTDQLLSTFNAVLSITQIDAGQQRATLETMDAHDILEGAADLYGPLVEESNGSLKLVSEPGLAIRAKRELLAQAVTNLIDNAIKYGAANGAGPNIVVSGTRQNNEVIISVADHGGGIAENDRERVLQRFVRLDQSRSLPGNGLGLSLVESVTKLLNGKVILEDNAPGLRAELHLPFAKRVQPP